ncbi:hypothetical protein [Streptomyces triticirhizae]|uniref:LamG domain-containing protein n=1 Tax=Streptomyces triticirhizae TaxID=2483353 RepID=A0A3M2M7X7_9ACTN|nr:hypothetical protein [Streptomyces triticirhizae]RMI43218.1 hypothetical protein EBN88_07765 [Streptomyces triticirhizae]
MIPRTATHRRLATVLAAAGLLVSATATAAACPTPDPEINCATDQREFLFCEDFELLPPGEVTEASWGVDTRDGGLTVVDDERAEDGQALAVRTEGNGHAFLTVEDFEAPGNSFYGRMDLFVAAFPTEPDWAHFTLVEAAGEGDGTLVRPIGGQYVPEVGDGVALWGVGSDGGPTGDWTDWRESAPAEAGRWTCVEWRQDASDNRVDVWLDGEHQPDLTVTTTQHGGEQVDFVFPEFDTVRVGWQLYQVDPYPTSYDLLLDDVVLAKERVGCEG